MARLNLDAIWPRLIAAADEMATTLFRTAFSHDVVEVHDMSTGLYDDRGNLLGQTWLGATGHVGVMPVVGKELVRKLPTRKRATRRHLHLQRPLGLQRTDGGCFHLHARLPPDRVIGYSVTTVHHVDIGGRKGRPSVRKCSRKA